MSTLKAHEKVVFEKLFDRGGYVLDFTDPTFSAVFRENHMNIDGPKYKFNGASKMKRLRAFWEVEPDVVVSSVLEALLQYAEALGEVGDGDKQKAVETIDRLAGRSRSKSSPASSEADFLATEFAQLNLARLSIDTPFQQVIEQRIGEIHKALSADAPLAVIFLCGSTLEGLLLDAATKNSQQFNQANSAPKDKTSTTKQFHEWTLDSLINVAHEVGLLSLDIKKHSHSLKDFRNYIHPRQQAVQDFRPDAHTAKISWHVLQAAIANLSGQRK